jgi:hypothetical protein
VDPADIENRFTYHPPSPGKARQHERVRSYLRQMAEEFNGTLPEGREKSLVMTHLEEAAFWANAAIARHGAHGPG